MGAILFGIYMLITLISMFRKKSIFSITLIYLIIAPQIKFGNSDIDAMYLVIIYLIGILLLIKKRLKIQKEYSSYIFLIIINFLLYFIMTLIKNQNITSSGIASMIGFLKIPILIIIISTLFQKDVQNIRNYDKVFQITIIINFIGVLLQFIFGAKIRAFFENMYLTDSYRYYSALSDNMVYNRKFGFFGSPMLLGAFCSFLMIFFISRYLKTRELKHLYFTILTIVTGITSLSKTFFIGIPLIILMFIVIEIFFYKKNISITKRFIKGVIILILAIPIIISGYNYMAKNSTINYYLKMLANPLDALNTRYNNESEDLLLSDTYKIIKENIVFGVGFQKIDNEFLGDSTYVLALHNGGVISLGTIILFYILQICDSLINRNFTKIIFLIFWSVSGLGMNNLFNVMMILPFFLCLFRGDNKDEKDNRIYKKSQNNFAIFIK